MAAGEPLVDYRTAASRYDSGRALDEPTLERWRIAIAGIVGGIGDHAVVDIGAGTGLFASAWDDWGAERVVAVEPSEAMRAQALARPGHRYDVLAGNAASIPLEDASASICWMSAVLHHIPDTSLATIELARVLRPGGFLLVRGFFPGLGAIPWLPFMPGHERAEARFPDEARTLAIFAGSKFEHIRSLAVTERETTMAGDVADWVDRMRGADSLLTALESTEIETGIRHLRQDPTADIGPLKLGLIAFRRS